MELALYLASLGFRGIWFASGKDQIDQPKIYMKYIIESSYLKFLVNELLKESVTFLTGGSLKLKNLTELNSRSARADFIIYDEEAQADEDAYNAAINILAGSSLGLIVHISTARKGTLFERNYDRLKLRGMVDNEKYVFLRRWYEIEFLAAKREWYEQERERLRKEGKEWFFRQEHECSFELPTGAIFKNIISDVFDSNGEFVISGLNERLDHRIVSGVDWNPVGSHWLVSGRYTKDLMGFVIFESKRIAIGYTHQLRDELYEQLKEYSIHHRRICMEGGGINEEYKSWFNERLARDRNKRDMFILWEEWDSQGINKVNACLYLEDKTIYVDEILFPELYKQISEAHWKEEASRAEVEKDPAHSPHALDAFLHATNKRLLKEVGLKRFDWYGSS